MGYLYKKISLIAVLLFFLTSITSKGEDEVNVLFISSFEKSIPASVSLERGLSKAFEKTPQRNNIFYEYMDFQELELKSYYFYRDYLKEKYLNVEFDYIVCWGFNSIELLALYRDIFPNSKRIFLEGSKKMERKELYLESDTIIKTVPDYLATIEEILRVKKTEKIIVIGTSDRLGQNRVDILKKIISGLKEEVKVEYLLDKNIDEISGKLDRYSSNTIAFYLLMFSDGFGKKMTPYEISQVICGDSKVPVFSFWDALLGSGIAGGNLISFEVVGEEVGNYIFSGEDERCKKISPMSVVYDYRALKKWDINERKLLPTARVINEPPNFLIRYKMEIFILTAVLTFMMTVTFLIYRQLLMKKTNKKFRVLYEEIKEKNQQLNIISELDSLTGLKNRRAMDKAIKKELERSTRYGEPLSTLLIDVDNFKKINDTYGHNTGDIILCEISQLLRENIRSVDSIARWGGEEFLILAPGTDLQETMRFGEKIRGRVEKFQFTKIGRVTVSIGISQHREGETFNRLYERVDEALYSAKAKGRNRVEY